MPEIVAAHLERVARDLAERVDKLMDAADHLVWATEIEIQGGPRTRSFILQHRAKCRYNVEQTKKAMAALTGEQNGVAAALAACAREAARPFKEALMINPFSDGQDGDLCLWCRTSQPRGTITFEEQFLPEHHLSTCELMLLLEKWAALERAVGEKGQVKEFRG